MSKLVLAGGSGFIGNALMAYFKSQFSEIKVLTRNASTDFENVQFVKWDGRTLDSWVNVIDGADVVINLSGKNINCRFTESNKKEILESRINSTRALGLAIQKTNSPPKLWINFSAVAKYKNTIETSNNEYSNEQGSGFMYEVCEKWEAAFNEFQLPYTKKVILRVSVVLGKEGGMFPQLLPLVKFGLGGSSGNGKQMISWIHITDLCRLVEFVISHPSASGVCNAASENPISNEHFMKAFRKAVHVPIGIPAPSIAVKIGAFLIGTEPSLVLDSVNVIPTRLINEGFKFHFSDIEKCLENLMKN